ncbi:MAG: hypothetical protein JKY37_25445 [Nannocystaceae bacterium]|nr:hypothetical protein [Nannocystaceae bacterium]
MFGWLKRKFTGSTEGSAAEKHGDIMLGERDCHSHIIPGIDDGSRTMAESLKMLALLHAEGVRTLAATSHMFPSRFDNQPDDLQRGFEALERARDDAGIELTLQLGAEHYLDEDFVARIKAGCIVPFGPESYVLFETTTGAHAPSNLLDAVHEIRDRGMVPLVAHIERYQYLRDEEGHEMVEDLRSAGAQFQVNRTVGKANRPGLGGRGRMIAWLQARDWIDEVGSDLHRPTREGRPYAGDELLLAQRSG